MDISFNIHPTIVKTGFTIEFYSKLVHTFTLEIYDVELGERVYSSKINTNKHYVDISYLKSGTYTVKLGNIICKIIKQ